MATVTFTIPDSVVTELNQIAVKAGFVNAKLMTTAYLVATLKASRDKTIRDAIPQATMTDVVIS